MSIYYVGYQNYARGSNGAMWNSLYDVWDNSTMSYLGRERCLTVSSASTGYRAQNLFCTWDYQF